MSDVRTEKMVEASYCVGAVIVRTVNKAKVYQATYHLYPASGEIRLSYTQVWSMHRQHSSRGLGREKHAQNL